MTKNNDNTIFGGIRHARPPQKANIAARCRNLCALYIVDDPVRLPRAVVVQDCLSLVLENLHVNGNSLRSRRRTITATSFDHTDRALTKCRSYLQRWKATDAVLGCDVLVLLVPIVRLIK